MRERQLQLAPDGPLGRAIATRQPAQIADLRALKSYHDHIASRQTLCGSTSAAFIVLIGIWLLYNVVRHRHYDSATTDGRFLAFATGLVPCPLTTFIMVYAVSNGIITDQCSFTQIINGRNVDPKFRRHLG